jgi:type IV fimbrial biogenesis protein FimT
MHKQAGFTIMELMIVVAIIGILGAMALPGLKEWNRNAARTAAVSEFLGSMHLARSEAVKRNVRVGICPTQDATDAAPKCAGEKDWAIGWLVFVDTDGDMDLGADEEVLGAIDAINPAFSLISTNGDVALDFRPNGRMETSNLEVTVDFNLCDERGPEQGRVISVSTSGRPQSGVVQINGDKPNC